MTMRPLAKIVAFVLVGLATISWTEVPMLPEDGKIRLSGMWVDGYEFWRDPQMGRTFYVEYRWWGWDERQYTEAAYWYIDGAGGFWDNRMLQEDGFIHEFARLDDTPEKGVTRGPTVATVLGDIETFAFDVTQYSYGEEVRQCLGFRFWWDRFHQYYTKVLDFYACGYVTMTEERFIELLEGLSVEGEFEALVTGSPDG